VPFSFRIKRRRGSSRSAGRPDAGALDHVSSFKMTRLWADESIGQALPAIRMPAAEAADNAAGA